MAKHTRFVRLPRTLRRDGGFTVIETMVALAVILSSVVVLAYVTTSGFSRIAYSRQRQAATAFANQTMEQIRGLPFDTLKNGLSNLESLLTDPNISKVGTQYFYAGEQLANGAIPLNPPVVPLVPHQQSLKDATQTTYNVATYVTNYNNITTNNTYRVTVVVSWLAGGRTSKVQTQSVFYSGSGCLSTQTHPFAAPCQPYFFVNADNSSGLVDFAGSLQGGTLSEAKLYLPTQASSMEIEQTSIVQGTDYTGGAALTKIGFSEQVIGKLLATSGADNDPGQPGLDYQTTPVPAQSSSTLQATGTGGLALTVKSSSADTGSTTSTTSASISPSHPCPDLLGVNQTDSLPCGNTNGRMGAAETALLDVFASDKKVGTATVASLGVPSASSTTYTDRATAPEGAVCPSTSGEGCAHAQASRSLGTITLGGLPDALDPGVPPPGWGGYLISVNNVTQTASADVGLGAAAPTAGVSGTLSVWNGIGYTAIALTSASVPVVVPPVHVQEFIDGKLLTIDITASLSTGGTTINDPAGCVIPCTRTSATATSNSPLVGTITYIVNYNGAALVSLTISPDLGFAQATGTYQKAPSG